MPSPVGVHALGHSRAVDEVEALVDRTADHPRGGLGVIGRVAVHQHKDIGVNVGEHATNDISLSLARLAADNRARSLSDVDCAIGRVVVVNVDCCQWQSFAKSNDCLSNRQLFIEAGDQNCDFVLTKGRLGH